MYLAPDLFRVDESIFHAICNIRLEQQNDFSPNPSFDGFDDFGKVQYKFFFTKSSKVLNNFQCYISIHLITRHCGKILEQAKFPA